MKKIQKIYAWSVHFFTSLGATFGVIAIVFLIEASKANVIGNIASYQFNIKLSLLSIIVTIFIDSIDGSLARLVNINKLALFDGTLLDNIIDFTNYSIVPCICIYVSYIIDDIWILPTIIMITISSSYQFCQINAKTSDNFFLGFPSYWNIIVILMICFKLPQWLNEVCIIVMTIFSFIPIKYIYLSRVQYISNSKIVKILTLLYMLLSASATILAILLYPNKTPSIFIYIIISFIIFYILFSFKLNIKPIQSSLP